MAERDQFDTQKFIEEILHRPAIWDTSSDDYTNRELKRAAWEELTDMFAKEGESFENKIEFGRSLQRKWKSLRDCYSRERKRLKRLQTGSAVPRKNQYIFYNNLNFLSDVVKCRSATNDTEEEETEVKFSSRNNYDSVAIEESQPSTSTTSPKMRKAAQNPCEEITRLIDVIQTNIQRQQEVEKLREDDDDRLFLLSLLNPMKRLSDNVRFSIRTQFSQIMENALKCLQDSTPTNFSPYEDKVTSNKITRTRRRKIPNKAKAV